MDEEKYKQIENNYAENFSDCFSWFEYLQFLVNNKKITEEEFYKMVRW